MLHQRIWIMELAKIAQSAQKWNSTLLPQNHEGRVQEFPIFDQILPSKIEESAVVPGDDVVMPERQREISALVAFDAEAGPDAENTLAVAETTRSSRVMIPRAAENEQSSLIHFICLEGNPYGLECQLDGL